MRIPSVIRRRRPSAAMLIAGAALFVSLGGVGYAASGLITSRQIANGAVSYRKIKPNSVGRVRLAKDGVINSRIGNGAVSGRNLRPGVVGAAQANTAQLQARVAGTCPSGQGVGAVANTGAVTCNPSLPAAYANQINNPVTLTAPKQTVLSLTLPASGSYLVSADMEVSVTSGSTRQSVSVACTMDGGYEGATAVLHTDGTSGDLDTEALPFQGISDLPVGVDCNALVPAGGPLPDVAVVGSISALAITPSPTS